MPPRRAPLRGRSRERIPWRDLLTPEPDGQGPVLNGAPAADVLPQGTAASAGRGAESLRWLGTGVLFRCVGDRFRVRLMSSRDRKVRHSHKRQRGRFPGLEQFLGAQPAVVHTAPARVDGTRRCCISGATSATATAAATATTTASFGTPTPTH